MEGWGKGEEVRGVEQRKRRKKDRQTDRLGVTSRWRLR